MNKTVNINLANTFFHIDEGAYSKLRQYLETIKRAFATTTGNDEILADIESRIAELFQSKVENERQVITEKEVDEVIAIMGQPEDYLIDEDIFEDEPVTKSKRTARNPNKKLYRDIETKYIGGVCSGLEHYTGIDALWIRLIFVILVLAGVGFGFIAYILLWILVPEAISTTQKLHMKGEAVNISNIEKKVKEGFNEVADTVKNVDYNKMGNKIKSGSATFFDTIGSIFMFIFKIFGKFIGIILILTGASALIGLVISLFSIGILDLTHFPGHQLIETLNNTGAPIWVVSILSLFAIGIPFFFLLYLGLKILVSNLKSIGNIAKYSLLGLWLIAVIGLTVFAVKQAAEFSHHATTNTETSFAVNSTTDTITIKTFKNPDYSYNTRSTIGDMHITYDTNGDAMLYSENIHFDLATSPLNSAKIKLRKESEGISHESAKIRAQDIKYSYSTTDSTIILNGYLTTPKTNQFRSQRVRGTLLLPKGSLIKFTPNSIKHFGWNLENDNNLNREEMIPHVWKMGANNLLLCQDCEPENIDEPVTIEEENSHSNKVIINEDGIDINIKDESDTLILKIDENGIKINASDN